MTESVYPASFSDELLHNKHARDAYERMSPAEKCRILARAEHIRTAENMHIYVMSLAEEEHANEYF